MSDETATNLKARLDTIKELFLKAHIGNLKQRPEYQPLFAAGEAADAAVGALISETVLKTKDAARSSIVGEVTEGLVLLLKRDLEALERQGLSQNDKAAFAADPKQALFDALNGAYGMVIRALDVMATGTRIVDSAENCDCEFHRAQKDEKDVRDDLGEDAGKLVITKPGQA